jgi:putative transposase
MRYSRGLILPALAIFHFIWRCINGEKFMGSNRKKAMFLDSFFGFIGRARNQVKVFAFCVMSNHFHKASQLKKDCRPMSDWARSALSSFAQRLNRSIGRKGPVGQDRPKTIVCQDRRALMRLMFYIDWNPVRAGLVSHPSEYRFSSYRYYAYGEVNEWTRHLTPPDWYVELGDTPEQRQKLYRFLCDEYHRRNRLPSFGEAEDAWALGTEEFVRRRAEILCMVAKVSRRKRIPPKTLSSRAARILAAHTDRVAA